MKYVDKIKVKSTGEERIIRDNTIAANNKAVETTENLETLKIGDNNYSLDYVKADDDRINRIIAEGVGSESKVGLTSRYVVLNGSEITLNGETTAAKLNVNSDITFSGNVSINGTDKDGTSKRLIDVNYNSKSACYCNTKGYAVIQSNETGTTISGDGMMPPNVYLTKGSDGNASTEIYGTLKANTLTVSGEVILGDNAGDKITLNGTIFGSDDTTPILQSGSLRITNTAIVHSGGTPVLSLPTTGSVALFRHGAGNPALTADSLNIFLYGANGRPKYTDTNNGSTKDIALITDIPHLYMHTMVFNCNHSNGNTYSGVVQFYSQSSEKVASLEDLFNTYKNQVLGCYRGNPNTGENTPIMSIEFTSGTYSELDSLGYIFTNDGASVALEKENTTVGYYYYQPLQIF